MVKENVYVEMKFNERLKISSFSQELKSYVEKEDLSITGLFLFFQSLSPNSTEEEVINTVYSFVLTNYYMDNPDQMERIRERSVESILYKHGILNEEERAE